MKNVALHNLGCKVNAYELEAVGQKLQELGYRIVPFEEKADVYIVNTCTVTNIADRKSRQMLHRARKNNPEAVVVAMGCYAQTSAGQTLMEEGIDLVVGNNRKKDLPALLEALFEKRSREGTAVRERSVADLSREREYERMELTKRWGHTRAYLKIQDGCDQFCSYCIIPYARGRARSRLPEDVLAKAKALAREGCKEVVLTGIHLSSYGKDLAGYGKDDAPGAAKRSEGDCLLELIQRLADIEGIRRIRLGSLEPGIITPAFVRQLSGIEKLCPHFHLSLQSGCDETLKRMNRHYTSGEYYEKTVLLREGFDTPAITTDVIVGFPGETEAEFSRTEAFLKKTGFYEMHVFKYSARKGTAAAVMPDQVAEEIKNERSARLLALKAEQSATYRAGYIGKEITILTEDTLEKDGVLYRVGHTPAYVKAAFDVRQAPQWDRANCLVSGTTSGMLDPELLLLKFSGK